MTTSAPPEEARDVALPMNAAGDSRTVNTPGQPLANSSEHRGFELVARAKSGDAEAFAELIQHSSRMCRTAARSILRDPMETEDQIQNALLKAWRNIGFYREDAKFSTWLLRIVINECLMAVRQRTRHRQFPLELQASDGEVRQMDIADGRPGPEQRSRTEQEARLLRYEISRSPAMFRDVLRLTIAGRCVADVAQELGISIAAAKSRLLRARQHLGRRMKGQVGHGRVRPAVAPAVTFFKSSPVRHHPNE